MSKPVTDLSTQLGGRRKEEVITELLEAVQKLTDSDRRKLLEELPIQLLEKSDPVAALLIARTIGDTAQRAKTLMKIAPHLVQLPTDELYRLWKETLRVLGQRSRTDLLTDLHSLEVIFNVLEPGSVSHIAQSIRKIIRWW